MGGRGQDRRGIGADGEEPGDAGVEETGEAPLHVEAQADHGVDTADGQERQAVERQTAEIDVHQ